MPDSISLGPLLLPTQALLLLLATAAALGVLGLLREGAVPSRARAEMRLFAALAIGMLAARIGWIVQHWQAYAESPWAVLAFRDGGYVPWIGLVAGLAAVSLFVLRVPAHASRPAEGAADGAVALEPEVRRLQRRQLWVPAAVGGLTLLIGQWLLTANAQLRPLPTFEVIDMAGSARALPGESGRPRVINLWASWCAPCRREMPAFARVQAQRPDVEFVYLNIGESVDEILAFTRTLSQPLTPILRDPKGQLPERLDVRGYPTTLILDAEGRLLHRRTGELSEASLKALLPPP